MVIDDKAVDEAIELVEKALLAAKNHNQAGEDAIVAMAHGLGGVAAAAAAYESILTLPHIFRTGRQRELCLLRDFIANATATNPQVVQDRFEQLAAKVMLDD